MNRHDGMPPVLSLEDDVAALLADGDHAGPGEGGDEFPRSEDREVGHTAIR